MPSPHNKIIDIVKADFSEFGSRELHMAAELLTTYDQMRRHGKLPEEWYDKGVHIAFNTHSGFVFMSNSDYQSMLMNGDKLEMWYNCSECGEEGFKEDIDWNEDEYHCGNCRKGD